MIPHAVTDLYAKVIVDAPLPELDYKVPLDMQVAAGDRVLVQLVSRKIVGIVTSVRTATFLKEEKIRKILAVLPHTEPVREEWLQFTKFAADYYLGHWGEAALAALPKLFRRKPHSRMEAALAKLRRPVGLSRGEPDWKPLNAEQQAAVDAVVAAQGFQAFLLFGVTGSGKTEVYLNVMRRILERDPQGQALLLVPEINLTPQLEDRVRSHFPGVPVVTLHSELSDGERAANWLAVHEGRARILVGTRLSVFASFKRLSLVIVDEEHDPSFKAGQGLRHSARDLAVMRASLNRAPCVLGSATPALETWKRAGEGAYRRLDLTQRAVASARLPSMELVDMKRLRGEVFSPRVAEEVTAALRRGEQVLIFINRRGYSPVLSCTACGWVTRCRHCSGFTVYHKHEGKLICHHCGAQYGIPERCPTCGNVDLVPEGTGTQRLQEDIEARWPDCRIERIDRDSVRGRDGAEAAFKKVHSGQVDLVVGTQMIAKGHDFQRVSLVVALNVDAQLVSASLRAEERLFATLMQVAGRAGRAATPGRVLIQTRFIDHPLFEALRRHDYASFAERALAQRRDGFAPPYAHQALLVAEADSIERALLFLKKAAADAEALAQDKVFVYDPVPMALQRLMDVERAQLLVEADSRSVLHDFLVRWQAGLRGESGLRWHMEVDPAEV
ncbi:MAG: primosomal protein N' [Duodenibacillus sp.]|nr:primosomal protein N' [Duodenibacillus sp.]